MKTNLDTQISALILL